MMKSALQDQSPSMDEDVLSSRRSFLFGSPVTVHRGIRLDHFFRKIKLRMLLMIDSKDMSRLRVLSFNLHLVFRHNFRSTPSSSDTKTFYTNLVRYPMRLCARRNLFVSVSSHVFAYESVASYFCSAYRPCTFNFERGKVRGNEVNWSEVHEIFRAHHVCVTAFSLMFSAVDWKFSRLDWMTPHPIVPGRGKFWEWLGESIRRCYSGRWFSK